MVAITIRVSTPALEDLIDLNILRVENFDVFLSIDKHATREQKVKEELAAMQTWLNELISRMIKYGAAHKPTTTTSNDELLLPSLDSSLTFVSSTPAEIFVPAALQSLPRIAPRTLPRRRTRRSA
jgi:hypothetical protein